MNSKVDSWPSLGCPRPKSVALPYAPVTWNHNGIIALPWQSNTLAIDVQTALAARRTRRNFGLLPRELLAAMLQSVQAVTESGSSELGFPTSFRPTPSAGAIHPVHLVISSPDLPGWHRYDPFRHVLLQLTSKVNPAKVRQHVDEVVSSQQGTLLMLVAEPAMTAAKYDDAASLVWRDAGVLLGYLSVAAQALELNFCVLGTTGEPWAGQLVDQPGLYGVGLALIGTLLS